MISTEGRCSKVKLVVRTPSAVGDAHHQGIAFNSDMKGLIRVGHRSRIRPFQCFFWKAALVLAGYYSKHAYCNEQRHTKPFALHVT